VVVPQRATIPLVGLRISKETRAAIKKWASTQHDHPNFSEAVRRLIEIGLKSLDEFEKPNGPWRHMTPKDAHRVWKATFNALC
jgi:hypothetical protein